MVFVKVFPEWLQKIIAHGNRQSMKPRSSFFRLPELAACDFPFPPSLQHTEQYNMMLCSLCVGVLQSVQKAPNQRQYYIIPTRHHKMFCFFPHHKLGLFRFLQYSSPLSCVPRSPGDGRMCRSRGKQYNASTCTSLSVDLPSGISRTLLQYAMRCGNASSHVRNGQDGTLGQCRAALSLTVAGK